MSETDLDWLLDSDPSIRWQVMNDLLHESDAAVARERSLVALEGWGGRLLDLQGSDGRWGGAVFAPRAWTSTFDTLQLLRDLGVDPASGRMRRAIGRVRDRCTWGPEFGDSPFFEGEVKPCINGRVLAIGAYFGEARDPLVDRLLREQLPDGGWNCDAPPSQRSSFHTTMCVLEGLLEFEHAKGSAARRHLLPPSRPGVPPRAPPVPIAIDWRDHRPRSKDEIACRVDNDFISHALALRHPLGARLPAPGRRRAR